MVLKEFYKSSYSNLLIRIQQLNKIYHESNRINEDERSKFKNTCFMGLSNFGNTCFINTIIISILNLKPLADSIMDTRTYFNSIITTNEFNFFNSFVNLLYEYHNEKTNQTSLDLTMYLFCKNFYSNFSAQFTKNSQEDANYFLTTIVSMIDDVYGEIETIINYISNSDYGIRKDLFVDKFLNINIINEFKCLTKNHISISNELQMMLTLDIMNCHSLVDAIDLYFEKVYLADKENLFFCSVCQNYVIAEKTIKITRLPEVLIIYIKLFNSNVIKRIFLHEN